MDLPIFNVQEVFELRHGHPEVRGEVTEFTVKLPYKRFLLVYLRENAQHYVLVNESKENTNIVELDVWVAEGDRFYDFGSVDIPKSLLYGRESTRMEIDFYLPKIFYRDTQLVNLLKAHLGAEIDLFVFALKLMQCKNIEYIEYDPNKGQHWRNKRTVKKKPKPPFLKYKILQINPVKLRKQEINRPEMHQDGAQRLHTVRGHFKTYTPDRPLFGRLVGTFWWGDCVKGNPEFGLTEKDYRLKIDRAILDLLKPSREG